MEKIDQLYNDFRAARLPHYMFEGVSNYLLKHMPAGDFLMAVFRNDLSAAVAHADAENQRQLVKWVEFLWGHVPAMAWGSSEKVIDWLQAKHRKPAF